MLPVFCSAACRNILNRNSAQGSTFTTLFETRRIIFRSFSLWRHWMLLDYSHSGVSMWVLLCPTHSDCILIYFDHICQNLPRFTFLDFSIYCGVCCADLYPVPRLLKAVARSRILIPKLQKISKPSDSIMSSACVRPNTLRKVLKTSWQNSQKHEKKLWWSVDNGVRVLKVAIGPSWYGRYGSAREPTCSEFCCCQGNFQSKDDSFWKNSPAPWQSSGLGVRRVRVCL